MGESRGACTVLMGNLKERYYLEVLMVDGMVILKLIFKKSENVIGE
jgi:hypothetical protein